MGVHGGPASSHSLRRHCQQHAAVQAQHGARTSTVYHTALSMVPSVCATRVSKRRAWGAAQAMRTFRRQRVVEKTGGAEQGASWVCLACSVANGQTCVQAGRKACRMAKGESPLLAVVVYQSHYRQVDSH